MHTSKSGELVLADEGGVRNGVWNTQTVQKKPKDERRGHQPARGGDQDGRPRSGRREDCGGQACGAQDFYVQNKDLEEHGYSAGRPGCISISKNRRPHSTACRRQLKEVLKDSDTAKAANERITDALAKCQAGQDREEAEAARIEGR